MGCVYTGFKGTKIWGTFKIGQTIKSTPNSRYSAYDLNPLSYIECPKATLAELLYLEGVARLATARLGLEMFKTDFFKYRLDKTQNPIREASAYAEKVIAVLEEECQRNKIEYIVKKIL